MANRSHLYTCDHIPGGKFHARGLSEYNWDIPLAHKLMMANAPRVVQSAIWSHEIGVIADRAGAFERVIAFFDKVGEGTLAKRAEFDTALAEMKAFLAKTPPSKYILMEAGEIFDIMGGELAANAQALVDEIPGLVAKADRAIAGKEAKWLGQLRKKWQDTCHPGYWSDILYFDLSPPKKPKPKKKKPAAKKKKPAAKKPKAKAKAKPKKR